MKYPAVFPGSKYTYTTFLVLIFLAVTFADAQDAAFPDISRGDQAAAVQEHIASADLRPAAGRTAIAEILKRESAYHNASRAEVPHYDLSKRFETPVVLETPKQLTEPGRTFERILHPAPFAVEEDTKVAADREDTAVKDRVTDDDDPVPGAPPEERFHWGSAIKQSLVLLGIQHGYAIVAQEKTRRALADGNFFTDYWRSVRSIKGWDDGNRFFTNYIAHPMQGGLTGFIFVQNHDRIKKQKFAESKQYWKDRFKALVWSTAWSTQFELGPISQSSIGNVGKYGHMGYVDLVVTPTVGTAWLISEEAIDRYIIRHLETHSLPFRAIARMFLNPMRTIANMLRLREPWYRDRPLEP